MKEYKWVRLNMNSYNPYQRKEGDVVFSEYPEKTIQAIVKEGWNLHTYQASGQAGESGFDHFFLFERESD